MAWTDYSSTASGGWAIGDEASATGIGVETAPPPAGGAMTIAATPTTHINSVENLAFPGFDDGYAPVGIPDPIYNNIDTGGGGGGPTRPSSGFLYPRGLC